MLHLVRLLRHKHGRLPHNRVSLPFDTLTKVYHDAVHAKETQDTQSIVEQHQKSERERLEKISVWEQPLSEWHNEIEVTNHVGNLGVMSIYRSHTRDSYPSENSAESRNVKIQLEKQEELKEMRYRNEQTNSKRSMTSSTLEHLEKVNEHVKKVRWQDEELKMKNVNNSIVSNTSSARHKTTRRLSGVQLEILSLYRHLLKETNRFCDEATRVNMRAHIREEFIKHVNIPRRNIIQIEWQINYAKRKLEDMRHMHANTKFSVMR